MNRFQATHLRLLRWVETENWQAFSSEDELTLRALMLTGYLACVPVVGDIGKIRIKLTPKGAAYMEQIGQPARPRMLIK